MPPNEDVFGIDPQYYSTPLNPGEGSMGSSGSASWKRLIYQHSLLGTKWLYVHLDVSGANSEGCYGAGKLVD